MYQSGSSGMQEVIQMCSSFESNKSTKGASKLRRDLINGEIANLRDLLPLPSSTRQRLSQLQLMALVCVYVRKANYFQQVFKRFHELGHPYCTPNIGFSKALSGFLIMMTQNGKLLYISDNAAEYLGHSMEDLLIHGDSVYDIIDKADHGTVQTELLRNGNAPNSPGDETRLFLCRMNVSRNARRQMRFGDQKVVLLQGHYLSYLPLCSRNEPVFVATCTPVAMPETRECVVQGATNVFTSIHAMDMKFMHIDRNGEYYLGYTRSELGGISWYQLIHWNYMREAQSKHRLISQSEQEKSCILLVRLQTRSGGWIWVHCVLQVKDSPESAGSNTSAQSSQQQSVIVATNQVLSEREATVMRVNSWIYHYYTVQTKLQYGLAYPEGSPGSIMMAAASQSDAAARIAAAATYLPTPHQLMNYGPTSPQSIAHHQTSPDTSSNGAYTSPPMTSAPPYVGPIGYPYNYHHRHTYDMASMGTGQGVPPKKETPLDFSLAGSPLPHYDFHLGGPGYPPGSTYWTHHHPQYHGSTAIGGSYVSRGSDVSPSSVTSPQAWAPSPSSTQGATNQKHHQQSANTLSTRRNSTNTAQISLGSSKGRKRSRKNQSEMTNDRPLSPVSPSPQDGALERRLHSPGGYYSTNNDQTVATVTTLFPYHARSRSVYKLGVSNDDSGFCSNKEEGTIVSCPLTPSPVWEGQTQRPLEIQFCSDGGGSGGFIPGVGHDMVQCFPGYHSYLPFCANTTSGGGYGGSTTYNLCVGYYGSGNPHTTSDPNMLETGSPNKENRLPPTPESSDHDGETEDNRPLKWETL